MRPEEFLDVAEALATGSALAEAACRTAIGRAYYALFNEVRLDLEANVAPIRRDAGAHETTYRWLHNCGLDEGAVLAEDLADLGEKRNHADYRLQEPFVPAATVKMLLAVARSFLKRYRALRGPSLYSGVRAYRRMAGES